MKNILLIALIITSNIALSGTTLLLVGGGNRPAKAFEKLVNRAGGAEASFLVFPWASATTEGADNIRAELLTHNPKNVEVIPHQLSEKEVLVLKNKIKNINGIFFSGGDQNELMKFILKYDLYETFKAAYKNGVAFGGTSAGTAIMSNPMLTGESDLSVIDPSQTELTLGLGLLPENIIVDQHFVMRSRFNRLASLILGETQRLGIGIDENTSLLVTNDEVAEVIGPTQVLFYRSTSKQDLSLKILKEGEIFNLNK